MDGQEEEWARHLGFCKCQWLRIGDLLAFCGLPLFLFGGSPTDRFVTRRQLNPLKCVDRQNGLGGFKCGTAL